MVQANTPIHQLVYQSISTGTALSAGDIRSLREKNEKAIKLYKLAFWVAIAIFNVLIFVPLPLSTSVLIPLAVVALACAFIVPIYGIRKHQKRLNILEDTSPGPKKSRASEEGRAYIASVRQEGRAFVKAEVEALETSRKSTS